MEKVESLTDYEHGPWCWPVDEDHTETLKWLAERLHSTGKELSDFSGAVHALDYLFPLASPDPYECPICEREPKRKEERACHFCEVGQKASARFEPNAY